MLTGYVWRKASGTLTAGLLPPFIVFNGKTGATLDKKYKNWDKLPGHSGSFNFQSKHWFDATITIRWIKWMVSFFPHYLKLALIWDACPAHNAKSVKALFEQLETEERLIQCLIPGGLTSVLQVGDIVINGPCKKFLRKQYLSWQFHEIARRREAGVLGKLEVKINRELLMSWTEMFVDDFNMREKSGRPSTIINCLEKVGQNPFSKNKSESFNEWLDSLDENALYKSLLLNHTAVDL